MGNFTRKLNLGVFASLLLCLVSIATAQIASFEVPILGYLLDAGSGTVRPIAGIAGNARIDEPLALPFAIELAEFLPDHRHAIVSLRDSSNPVVLDLKTSTAVAVAGATPHMTSMQVSSNGKTAAFFYSDSKKLLIVGGLPDAPAVLASIDSSIATGVLTRFAVADDGNSALLAFSLRIEGQQDSLYSWTSAAGSRYIVSAEHISDIAILGDDGIVLDSTRDQVLWIRNIPGNAVATLSAASGDGLAHPVAVSTSGRNEVYVGDSDGGILILDSAGRIVRKTRCGCEITSMAPLANSAIRLTDRLDRPLLVLDPTDADRVFFIPALIPQSPADGGK
jgi:hypothetical protein